MANSSPATMAFFYDDEGGDPVDITEHILNINDIDVENLTEETRPFGKAWDTHKTIGVGRMPVIEMGGLYDDVEDGPDDLFADRVPEPPETPTRTFRIVWGSLATRVETSLLAYRRSADRNGLTKYTIRLQPTGEVVEEAANP